MCASVIVNWVHVFHVFRVMSIQLTPVKLYSLEGLKRCQAHIDETYLSQRFVVVMFCGVWPPDDWGEGGEILGHFMGLAPLYEER